MAYNKIIYKGDTLIDLTADTVTPETLAEGVTAHARNGEIIVGTNAGGAEVKLGELKISKNGEYEAPGSDAPSVGGTEVFDSTTPYAIDLGEEGGFWKSTVPVPTDIGAFMNSSTVQVVDSNGSVLGEMLFADLQWKFQEGVVAACSDLGMYIIYDPATFESLMGAAPGFEQGIYILDQGMSAEGMQLIITTPGGAGVDGYNKVVVDVPNGGLNWFGSLNSMQYAMSNGDLIIAGNGTIQKDIFNYNDSIKHVFILNGITSIDKHAFMRCNNIISVKIGNDVTSIGDEAIKNCENLVHIIIPDSVTSIGDSALGFCSSLSSIIYTGTIMQWNAITKSSYWNEGTPATHVQCSDGQVAL